MGCCKLKTNDIHKINEVTVVDLSFACSNDFFFSVPLVLSIYTQYVDESYQGGGIGEYSYYNPYKNAWDNSGCTAHGNGRCAPMDCHLTNTTTWKLMGVFKEASYFGKNAFFEQLFKHEGVCVWNNDNVYDFMSEARETSWPQGCVSTGIKGKAYYMPNGSSGYLYIDLKPTWNGNMTYGLYADSTCKTEYDGSGIDIDVDSVAASMGMLYGSSLAQWNEGLEIFKVCQPCRAYNLKNTYVSTSGGGDQGNYNYYNDPNEGYFMCDDDAGYTNVNQCMKFRTHAELEVATWEDLVTATNQGGILQVNVGGTVFGSDRMSAEQYMYMRTQQKSALAAAQQKAARESALVAAMEPKANKWRRAGNAMVYIGVCMSGIALLSIFRTRYECRRARRYAREEPLL
jgi:hypothetical protein